MRGRYLLCYIVWVVHTVCRRGRAAMGCCGCGRHGYWISRYVECDWRVMQFLVIIYFKSSSHSPLFSSLLLLLCFLLLSFFFFASPSQVFCSFYWQTHRSSAPGDDDDTWAERGKKRHWNVGETHSSAQFMTRPSLWRSTVSHQCPNIRHTLIEKRTRVVEGDEVDDESWLFDESEQLLVQVRGWITVNSIGRKSLKNSVNKHCRCANISNAVGGSLLFFSYQVYLRITSLFSPANNRDCSR